MIIAGRKTEATPKVLNHAENRLLQDTNGDDVLWLGRAASALIIAYKAILKLRPGIKNPEVIIPSMACSTPANTALMCGITPRFADIDIKTGLINLDSVKKRYTKNTVAVVFIHLYGNSANLNSLKKWCDEKNILLIEDIAQAQGAFLPDGNHAGSVGHFSVYSFNRPKILATGGGALVSANAEITKAVKDVCKTSLPKENHNPMLDFHLGVSYRNLHHSLVHLFRSRVKANTSGFFMSVQAEYEPLYFKTGFDAVKLAGAFRQLDEVLENRLQKARIYKKQFAGIKGISLLDGWENSKCCWRFSFLYDNEDKLVDVSQQIRNDGFHLSNLYWPVDQFFRPVDKCPNADHFARRIINLWVDSSVDTEWVKRCAASVVKNVKAARN